MKKAVKKDKPAHHLGIPLEADAYYAIKLAALLSHKRIGDYVRDVLAAAAATVISTHVHK